MYPDMETAMMIIFVGSISLIGILALSILAGVTFASRFTKVPEEVSMEDRYKRVQESLTRIYVLLDRIETKLYEDMK